MMRAALHVAMLTLLAGGSNALAEEPSASVRVAILVADAEELYRSGKPREAVKLYDRAAAKAFSEGASGRAFELSRTAAAIVQSLDEHADAGSRLRRLALGNVRHPDAPNALHAAILCLAQAAPDDPKYSVAYAEALGEYLDQWPDGPHAPEVRWWRARWWAAQGDWEQGFEALDAYQPSDPRFADAMVLLGSLAQRRVAELRRDHATTQKVKQVVMQVTDRLQPLILTSQGQWPESWTPQQRAAALSLARLHAAYADSGPEYPYRMLLASASGKPAPSEHWLSVAVPLLIEASVRSGHYDQAIQWCGGLPNTPVAAQSAQRLAMSLSAGILDAAEMNEIGNTLLALADRFDADDPPEWATRARGVGLAATGDFQRAAGVLSAFVETNDLTVLRIQALALSNSNSEEEQSRAADIWRAVESRHKPGTGAWYAGRLARIALLTDTGEREQAKKLLELTETLYPTPPNSPAKEQLAELRARLGDP